jgi:hypothetical protein
LEIEKMVVASPARLIGRSHKKQKDFDLTLRTLAEALSMMSASASNSRVTSRIFCALERCGGVPAFQ